jgi:ABC-type uncharacterized transport system permease subunit
MTWQIGWALILGFGLSAVIQAVVRKSTIVRLLGDDRPRTLVLAALITRFVRTGGVAMLRMMGGPPDTHEHDHSDSHASHRD